MVPNKGGFTLCLRWLWCVVILFHCIIWQLVSKIFLYDRKFHLINRKGPRTENGFLWSVGGCKQSSSKMSLKAVLCLGDVFEQYKCGGEETLHLVQRVGS